jgi:hypothetical protein
VVQAVVLLSFLVVCAACLLTGTYLMRRPDRSTHRPDGLDGVREARTAPVPSLPPAGVALAAPPELAAPVEKAPVEHVAAPPAAPMPNAARSPSSAAAHLRNGIHNSGSARFALPRAGRPGAADRDRRGSPARER